MVRCRVDTSKNEQVSESEKSPQFDGYVLIFRDCSLGQECVLFQVLDAVLLHNPIFSFHQVLHQCLDTLLYEKHYHRLNVPQEKESGLHLLSKTSLAQCHSITDLTLSFIHSMIPPSLVWSVRRTCFSN